MIRPGTTKGFERRRMAQGSVCEQGRVLVAIVF